MMRRSVLVSIEQATATAVPSDRRTGLVLTGHRVRLWCSPETEWHYLPHDREDVVNTMFTAQIGETRIGGGGMALLCD
jgi:hypothetical protein